MDTAFFEAGWDAATGALICLRDKRDGRRWADRRHAIGVLRYEIFSAADYAQKWRRYNQRHEENREWAAPDFLKPGLEGAVSRGRSWSPHCRAIKRREGAAGVEVRVELEFPAEAGELHGCPRRAEIAYLIPSDAPGTRVVVQWFGKPATRVAEALWFSLVPKVGRGGAWRLCKLGEWIDPRDVVAGGARALHAVEACRYSDGAGAFLVENRCAPLVAPGRPSLVRFSRRLPRPGEGLHFNLQNNTWGTNFPLWYEDDGRCEFVLSWPGAATATSRG